MGVPGIALLRRHRVATTIGACALVTAGVIPLAFASPGATLGIPAAIGVAVGTATSILAGALAGVLVALCGAVVFVVFVSEFGAGGYAALAVWPALTLAVGILVERSMRHRAALQQELEQANVRLRALLDAGIALNSGLELNAVLQGLVGAAAHLTGARYAALGLVAARGRGLEHFIHTGVDEATAAAIGAPPTGSGVLGALLEDPRPLRLADVRAHPKSAGFPPGHPPMTSFLGVPVLLRGTVYGNLYLADKQDAAGFTEEDEELVGLLATQAGVAIENARLYESSTRWLQQLESLNEVASGLTSELELERLLELIAGNLRELIDARLVAVMLPGPDGRLRVEAARGTGTERVLGIQLDRDRSKAGRVLARGRSERVDSVVDDPEVDQEAARRMGGQAAMFVPLLAGDRPIGVLACHEKVGADPAFSDDDLRLAEAFANRAAVAVDLSKRVAQDTLRSILEAQELERRRLALELHDETGQALTAILLGLGQFEARAASTERAGLAAVRELVVDTLRDVRRLAVELRPKVLDDFGLNPAIERLATTLSEQSGISVTFRSDLADRQRLPSEVETALYRIVQEAVTNVVKHARARNVTISLARSNGTVVAAVEDDGRGFSPADVAPERLGLVGMRERVTLLGGRLTVRSSPGGGTSLLAEVPVV